MNKTRLYVWRCRIVGLCMVLIAMTALLSYAPVEGISVIAARAALEGTLYSPQTARSLFPDHAGISWSDNQPRVMSKASDPIPKTDFKFQDGESRTSKFKFGAGSGNRGGGGIWSDFTAVFRPSRWAAPVGNGGALSFLNFKCWIAYPAQTARVLLGTAVAVGGTAWAVSEIDDDDHHSDSGDTEAEFFASGGGTSSSSGTTSGSSGSSDTSDDGGSDDAGDDGGGFVEEPISI